MCLAEAMVSQGRKSIGRSDPPNLNLTRSCKTTRAPRSSSVLSVFVQPCPPTAPRPSLSPCLCKRRRGCACRCLLLCDRDAFQCSSSNRGAALLPVRPGLARPAITIRERASASRRLSNRHRFRVRLLPRPPVLTVLNFRFLPSFRPYEPCF